MSKKHKNALNESKQKKQSGFKKWLLALLALLIIVGGAAFYFYQSRSIEGKWQSLDMTSQMEESFTEEVANIDESFSITSTDVLEKPELDLTVTDNNAKMDLIVRIKRDEFSQKMLDFVKNQINESLQAEGLDLNNLDPEIKQSVEATIPSLEEIKVELDKEMVKTASDMGGTYDKTTGIITTHIAKGSVDRIKERITLTSYNNKVDVFTDKDRSSYTSYQLKDGKLLIKGEKDKMTFTK